MRQLALKVSIKSGYEGVFCSAHCQLRRMPSIVHAGRKKKAKTLDVLQEELLTGLRCLAVLIVACLTVCPVL